MLAGADATVERRVRLGVRDSGIRVRLTDRARISDSPHQSQDWTTTYHLRWAEHRRQAQQPIGRAA